MLALLLGNSMRLMGNTIEYHAESLIQDVSPLLDGALSLYMFERDYVSMNETLRKLIKGGKSDLTYIIVLDESGKYYTGVGQIDKSEYPQLDKNIETAINDGVYDHASPLTLGGLQVGEVRFGISLKPLLQARSDLFGQGVLIASAEVLISIILLGFAGYFLTRHIYLLVSATRRIANGDYSSSIHKYSGDEIGELADNFNLMTTAIRERVEQLKQSQKELTDEKERILVTLHSIGDGVITTDTEGNVKFMNPVAEDLTGWKNFEAENLPLKNIFNITNEITGKPVQNPVTKCLETGTIVGLTNHTVLIRRDGHEFAIEDSAAPIRNSDNEIIGVILVFHDVSSARQLARQMAYQARHDSLTGLVNRVEFEDRLKEAIRSAQEEKRTHALFYMDLDQFKIVNDTCGHFAGDELLKQLTTTLKSKIRDTDTLARLGGDEFGVLIQNCDSQHAENIAEGMRKQIKEFKFDWEDKHFELGVSIGLVPINSECATMTEILSAADVACYIAKEKGRNQVHLHVAGDEEHALRQNEMQLVSDISSALEDSRFTLHCQEIVNINDRSENIKNYELLVRMLDKEGKLIAPLTFISAAERFHLIQQVDKWVVTRVIEFIESCSEDLANTRFSINLSGQSVNSSEFLEFLITSINNSHVSPQALCFEITETAAIENLKNASKMIVELKKLGCSFSLDDFGSGLSSFAYLKNLNVDYLKIDGGFVRDMLIDTADAAMVDAINQIGHVMGLKTIAEYVESHAIQVALANLGVDYVQGYAVHKPQPLENIFKKNGKQTSLLSS